MILKKNGFKIQGGYVMRESVELSENYRTLARAGMGAETKNSIKVGTEVDYYRADGGKYMGKITKITPKGYIVKDDKDGKNRQYTFHDRAKAKEILARIGKGKYNEEVELDEASILRTKTTRKQSDASKEKDRKKAVKTFKDIRKGKYPGVKMANEESIEEKAVSKAQQKFMGMVRATQKGEMDDASPEVKKAADSMSKKDVKDFAGTKHKGLPDKKEENEACWDGYAQKGMKKKGDRMVPNCVPESFKDFIK